MPSGAVLITLGLLALSLLMGLVLVLREDGADEECIAAAGRLTRVAMDVSPEVRAAWNRKTHAEKGQMLEELAESLASDSQCAFVMTLPDGSLRAFFEASPLLNQ